MCVEDGTLTNWGESWIQGADTLIHKSHKSKTICRQISLQLRGRSYYWVGGSLQVVPAAWNCGLCLFGQPDPDQDPDISAVDFFRWEEIKESRRWKALDSAAWCLSSYFSVLVPHRSPPPTATIFNEN